MTGPAVQLTLLGGDTPSGDGTLTVLLTASRRLGEQPGETEKLIAALVKLRNGDPGWQNGRPEEARTVLIHGGCPAGGDAIADGIWWGAWGMPTGVFLPDWDSCNPGCPDRDHRIMRHPRDVVHPHTMWADERAHGTEWGEVNAPWPTLTPGTNRTYCPNAGPHRNTRMIAAGPGWCLAFTHPDSKGSTSTARAAKKAGIRTTVIKL